MEISEWKLENKKLYLNPKYTDRSFTWCRFRTNEVTAEIEKITFKTGKISLTHIVEMECINNCELVLDALFNTTVDFITTSDIKADRFAINHFLNGFYVDVEKWLRFSGNVPEKMISPTEHLIEAHRIDAATDAILSQLTELAYY